MPGEGCGNRLEQEVGGGSSRIPASMLLCWEAKTGTSDNLSCKDMSIKYVGGSGGLLPAISWWCSTLLPPP